MNQRRFKKIVVKRWHALALMAVDIFLFNTANAQTADGNNGISQANTMVRSYFDTATQLMYAVGAILGLIGALRVYQLYGSHNGEATKAAAAWFGSCIFLVVVSTVIRSFFGL
jgi:hypothetical protein